MVAAAVVMTVAGAAVVVLTTTAMAAAAAAAVRREVNALKARGGGGIGFAVSRRGFCFGAWSLSHRGEAACCSNGWREVFCFVPVCYGTKKNDE